MGNIRKFVKKGEKVKKAMVICSGCNEEFSVYVHKKNDDAAWYVDNLPNCSHHIYKNKKKRKNHVRRS